MRGTLNAHKVFMGTALRPGYLKALDLEENREQLLREARDDIRQALREGMPQWQGLAKAQSLVESRYIAHASQLPPLRPRFRMQGSAVYQTLNDPAHKPPQEVDHDDGTFLPTSFVDGGGTVKPLLAAKGYFKVVEAILAPLCERKGWKLVNTKPTCVRVLIDPESHIDLPLYAIPDQEFVELAEESARAMLAEGVTSADSDIELAKHVYMNLPEDRIMLAHRDNGWIESDPRELEDWFLGAIRDHGEVVRRICRYLKGWRDYQWPKDGPSSITLMACVVTVFDDLNGTLPKNRDDLALQAVSHRLEELFSQPIANPVLPDQILDESWSPEERIDFKSHAAKLKAVIDGVLNGTFHKQIALSLLQERFGDRIPNDELLIEIDSEEREVLAYEPAKVAAPFVPRTTSG
ncbi:hypothetical protein HH303_18625 [Rhodospirillaceae bacterium KN72]|uniref:Cyclic GMP-AMP synthase n=1 Tax=Pacificispira spongiicola TaxID=2729598 RepID=A0A7Y0E3H6_9PROT|nr:hypothetical protein [Pacificispira spongiicola]NMM46513.1 hypothetical protein [Pacificispira spongiicola]